MDAIDLAPTRLERAKLKIHDLLAARDGGRTALFVYAGSTHMVVPLTTDSKLISMYLDALSTSLMPKRGKDTAAAIAAIQQFLNSEEIPGTVLLVTDGVEPQARAALQHFEQQGKDSILVLGVGTSTGGPIRTFGNEFLEDSTGRRIFSKLDVDTLKSLRHIGVSATTLTVDESDVKWIQRRAQSHLKSAQEETAQTKWMDEGYWLAWPIAVIGGLWFRKGWTVQWSGRAIALLFLLPQPTAIDARHRFLNLWMTPDQQGRYYFEKSDYRTATERFENPMWKGVAFGETGDYASAVDQFALSNTAEAWYNQGNALAHLNKLQDAVRAYEQALQRRPGWRDAEDNLRLVRSLIPPPGADEEQQELPPDAERGQTEMEDKGKKGKTSLERTQMDPEKMADIWMRNIQTSPAEFLRRRFAKQASEETSK